MSTMSDKEFDKQLRRKFEDFEIEPSPMVWEGINKSLAGTQRKPFPRFLVAAASITAIVAIGLWFAPHKEPIKLYGSAKVPEAPVQEKIDRSLKAESITSSEAEIRDYKPVLAKVSVKTEEKTAKNYSEETSAVAEDKPLVLEAPKVAQRVELIEKPIDNSPVVSEAFFTTKTHQDLLAVHEGSVDSTTDKSKHRIKSLGDLVNFVVGRVDKRKNKIIEFSKDDEGEEISGLNLGLLQYKTRAN